MSTSLALGIAGGVVGSFFGPIGAQVGFLAGSLVGNLIDPPKIKGPRLDDLKLQTSTYGRPIPRVWGTGRIAGNVIDQTDLQEHSEKNSGKGGPEIENFTYSASFAIQLCVGPIKGILRIWAFGRLIWSSTSGEPLPCTLYLGTEDQLPDPTFEAIHGVGEVSAYRGYAYVVFTDYNLTEFSNIIPQFEFEVYTAEGTYPSWVTQADFIPDEGDPYLQWAYCGSVYDGDTGIVTVAAWQASYPGRYFEQQYYVATGEKVPGTLVDIGTDFVPYGYIGIRNTLSTGVWVSGSMLFAHRGRFEAVLTGNPIGGTYAGAIGLPGSQAIYQYGYIYAFCNAAGITQGIARWPATDGVISGETDTWTSVYSFGADGSNLSDWSLGTSNTSMVYVAHEHPIDGHVLYEMDGQLNGIVRTWNLDAVDAVSANLNGHAFVVYERPTTGELILSGDRGQSGFKFASAILLGDDLSVTFVNEIYVGNNPFLHVSGCTLLGDGPLVICQGGIYTLEPPPEDVLLSTIVADISDLTPVTSYDVSELTDLVHWFTMASQMDARNAIHILRQAFFFDAVEVDDSVVFRKRGSASVVTIPDEDLAGREYGDSEPALLQTTRVAETQLPRTVSMTYIDIDTDYQIGTQHAPRQVVQTQSDVTVEVPIGLTATEALQKAWILQTTDWVERERFAFHTSRQYDYLVPCDVVTVRGRILRIQSKTAAPTGAITFEGVLSEPSLYTVQDVIGSAGSGFTSSPPASSATSTTSMVLLDLPMLTTTDYQLGHYVALGPTGAGGWPGGAAYKSTDAGVSYASIASTAQAEVIGDVATAPGDFAAGNLFDETNVITVVLRHADSTLEGLSETLVLAGGNLAVLGREVFQYKRADLVGTSTYELSGLLRGRFGTEWAIDGHGINEVFVALPAINVETPSSELAKTLLYKGVTSGTLLSSATAVSFANMGSSARPYAPVLVGGGADASDNVTITWTRRTRVNGAWIDYVDVPIGETTEAYVVQIWDSDYANCARVITGLTSETCSYTAAEQSTDFGAAQQTLYVTVGQVGLYQLGMQTRAVIPGGGSTVDAPLSPTTPYNAPPIPGAGGGAVDKALAWPYESYVAASFLVGDTFVASFTTGATTPGGSVSIAEYSSPPTYHDVRLATDVDGLSLVAQAWGNTATFIFGTGLGQTSLSTSTTYYLVIRCRLPDGSPSRPLGEAAGMIINLTAS